MCVARYPGRLSANAVHYRGLSAQQKNQKTQITNATMMKWIFTRSFTRFDMLYLGFALMIGIAGYVGWAIAVVILGTIMNGMGEILTGNNPNARVTIKRVEMPSSMALNQKFQPHERVFVEQAWEDEAGNYHDSFAEVVGFKFDGGKKMVRLKFEDKKINDFYGDKNLWWDEDQVSKA